MNNIFRSLMYHYVRSFSNVNPYAKFKDINAFKDECKFLKQSNEFYNISDLFLLDNTNDINKIFLTFDDGLKDHLVVAEELKSLNIKATFYISIEPFFQKEVLPVHKAHIIVSKIGPEALDLLFDVLKSEKIKNSDYLIKDSKNLYKEKYNTNNEEYNIKEFKRIINYYGNLNLRKFLLDNILKKLNITSDPKKYYLSIDEIIYLDKLGFEIGSHSYSHTLLSRLDKEKQSLEILKSKIFLENFLNHKVKSFCYPYGGIDSYNSDTLDLLKFNEFESAVSVGSRDIDQKDILNRFEIPRYDCNQINELYRINN